MSSDERVSNFILTGGIPETYDCNKFRRGIVEAEVQGYLTEFDMLMKQIRDATQGLNEEAANWRPLSKDTNSIYNILCHLIGTDNSWVRQVIGGETINRNREAEFRSSGNLSEVLDHWEKEVSANHDILRKITSTQLGEDRTVPTRGTITVRWCILHLISHYAMHLGHVQLTRQLWEQRHR